MIKGDIIYHHVNVLTKLLYKST